MINERDKALYGTKYNFYGEKARYNTKKNFSPDIA